MSDNNSIVDLENVVKQWANKFLTLVHSKAKLESVDINAKSAMMKQHSTYKVSFDQTLPIEYYSPVSTPMQSTAAFDQKFKNITKEVQHSTFSKIHETTSALTFSVTAGFSASLAYSIGVSGSVGVEGIAEVGASTSTTVSFEVNLSSTLEQSNTVTETWEVDQQIDNAPDAITETYWILQNRKTVYAWKWPTQMRGWVAIKFSDKLDLAHLTQPTFKTKPVAAKGSGKHQLWFFDVADVFEQIQESKESYSGLPDFTVDLAGGVVSLIAKGSLVAEGAFNSTVTSKEFPLMP